MNSWSFTKWLFGAVPLAVLVVAAGVAPRWVEGAAVYGIARSAIGLLGAGLVGWSLRGLLKTVDGAARSWVKHAQGLPVSLGLLVGLGGVIYAITGTRPGESALALVVAGVWLAVWSFLLLLAVARQLLRRGPGPIGVARAVLEEAVRMKVALVFIALLLVVLPALPLTLGTDEPLRYRVQSFLSYSLAATGFLLSLMTIFLACGTLSWEIEGKQIFTTAVKPISRTSYLLGKWLGVVVLNAVLLTVAGGAIYGFTVFYLAEQPAQDEYDRVALEQEVLTARVSAPPSPAAPLERRVEQRLQNLDPRAIFDYGEQVVQERGIANASPQLLEELGRERARERITQEVHTQARSVPPLESVTYIFSGLEDVKRRGAGFREETEQVAGQAEGGRAEGPHRFVQLRYKIDASQGSAPNGIPMMLRYNNNPHQLRMRVGQYHVISVPMEFIDDQGRLEVEVINPLEQNPTVTFAATDGLELLYPKDSFGANFVRAMAAKWIKLAFLAMLGLAAATFLGFPVACLLSLLVYFAAMASPYLVDAATPVGAQAEALTLVERGLNLFASSFAGALRAFAEYDPNGQIIDGRLFSWLDLGWCALIVGLGWTAAATVVGALIFRGRELARVQV